jgi:hypothetical protein
MKTVTARLDIEVFVDCPKCEFMIDLLKIEDTSGRDHNEEGHVLSQACPDGHWIDAHKEFEVTSVKCATCSETFNVKGLEW